MSEQFQPAGMTYRQWLVGLNVAALIARHMESYSTERLVMISERFADATIRSQQGDVFAEQALKQFDDDA